MKNSSLSTKEIGDGIMLVLMDMPLGTEISIYEMVQKVFPSINTDKLGEAKLIDIAGYVRDNIGRAGLWLDYSKWENESGLPFALSFVLRDIDERRNPLEEKETVIAPILNIDI